MNATDAIVRMFGGLLLILAFITSFGHFALATGMLVVWSYPIFVYSIAYSLGQGDRNYGFVLYTILTITAVYILIFTSVYYEYGLIENGKHRLITFPEALYFSITTWTTLGYGDFSPLPRIRLITSLEAILGYITMGVWITVIAGFINTISSRRRAIYEHNRKVMMEHCEDQRDNKPPDDET